MKKKEANIKKLPGAQTTIDVVCAPHPPSPAACTYSRPILVVGARSPGHCRRWSLLPPGYRGAGSRCHSQDHEFVPKNIC
jgi:hypothetical protein